MELVDAILKRKSVRSFKDDEIPDLMGVIAMARRAPSAGAIRGYRMEITKSKVAAYNAPAYAAVFADPSAYEKRYGLRGRDLYAVQDATIFAAYFQLLLTDMGLSSCWIGAFNDDKVRKMTGVSERLRPVAVIAIGYKLEQ